MKSRKISVILGLRKTDYIQATSALNMARRTLDYTVLTAPFDGFIEQRFVENHEEILTGQSIVRLIDPKDIEVNFMLPETSIQLLDIPKRSMSNSIPKKENFSRQRSKSISIPRTVRGYR